ncbi:S41 family peptidase [Nonomuraea sp. NPDC050328]|uniref:S41 family peptidase n=1 Tax=Nonomuraea sp. NPDC050328 TaxID=3364361 RepID=UPI0037B488FD
MRNPIGNPLRSLALAFAATALVAAALPASSLATRVAAPTCAPPPKPGGGGPTNPPPLKPTTVDTLHQAYTCLFDRYYGGPKLDNRLVLRAAFAGFTQELQRRSKDHPAATMPALTGDREADWAAFADVYTKVTAALNTDAATLQALAAATMRAMVASLGDNHARWDRPEPDANNPEPDPGGDRMTVKAVGISGISVHPEDKAAKAPLYVTSVEAGSPAAKRGIKPGDILVSINGHAPFVNGVFVPSALDPLFLNRDAPVTFRLRRPTNGRTWTLTVKPAEFVVFRPEISAKRLADGVAYVKVPGFFGGVADKVRAAVEDLRKAGTITGVVLDLRGNGGGSPREVTRLLGAFAHGKVTSYFCDVHDSCAANRTDDTVPLLNLPFVVLTDRGCASACDDFSAAVKGLGLAPLVGSRTAGVVSGPGEPYFLDDGSVLGLPSKHHRGPGKEIVDTIGVAADHFLPMTAEDLAAGRDPALAKALDLLEG